MMPEGLSSYREAEGGEDGVERGNHDVDDDAPFGLLVLSHTGCYF